MFKPNLDAGFGLGILKFQWHGLYARSTAPPAVIIISPYLLVQTLSLVSESGNLPNGSRVICLIGRFPKSSVA
jgi:hypothetical protein